ncbi:uncharacterized protein [Atheta coriaria]|uniref:uncharacterized protein n=1 Tax=Dalotia coriaria TaxID=877792 RepID=UPI0031F3CFF6
MGTNMLSAKKVKLHGLQDKRWTVQDHLTQYKGLVNLFKRDKKIGDMDAKLNIKKQKKEYKQLTRQIAISREELKNCMYGDQQKIRNILAEDRAMKLAYQELHATKVIDHIYQDNFARRKMLDLQNYRLKLKIDRLIKLRLEEGDLEMQEETQSFSKTPLEIQIGIVTGKVQDMILKKEAAITVKTTYKTLIDIMRKDAIYYDAVLETLKEDAMAQGSCLIQSTTLGQLAVEYVDDRRTEFETLQTCVKEDMKIRVKNLAEVKTQIEETIKNMRGLIRRDSDVTMCIDSHIPATESWTALQNQIQEFTDLLQILKETTLVSNFDAIFPCMQEQARQSERLTQFVTNNEESRKRLQEMKAHAVLIANNLENSMIDTTESYKETKKEYLEMISEELERKEEMTNMCEKRGKLLIQIRKILQHLEHITSKVQSEAKKSTALTFEVDATFSEDSVILPPLESDGLKTIVLLRAKINMLLTKFFDYDRDMTEATTLEAEEMYTQLITKTCKTLDLSAVVAESDLLEGLMFEDALIPTREFIKTESEQIVIKMQQIEEMMS